MPIRLLSHYYKRSLVADQSGATIVLVAIMLPLLISVMAITVDIARLYAVQSKAQSSLDTALLGAVASETTLNAINTEANALFDVNFGTNYMGGTKSGAVTVSGTNGVYNGAVTVRVPTSFLSLLNSGLTTFNLTAQVTSGFQQSSQNMELALVIDNSSGLTSQQAIGVRSAATAMVNSIFSTSNTLPNVYMSVVPYNLSVNVGSGRGAWVQPSLNNFILYILYNLFGEYGFLSNRNFDSPPNSYTDVSDSAPVSNATKFRLPQDESTYTSGRDVQYAALPEIAFGMNNKNAIISELNKSINSGDVRINVGLMWGWFTLSPNWQGVWTGSLPNRPANFSSGVAKTLVLVVGGKNNVFLGVNGTSNDNTTTTQLCNAIKAQGITLQVIAYSPSSNQIDEPILSNCASPGKYFRANNNNDVSAAFGTIYQGANASTVRLTK